MCVLIAQNSIHSCGNAARATVHSCGNAARSAIDAGPLTLKPALQGLTPKRTTASPAPPIMPDSRGAST